MLFFFKQKSAYELRISDWSSDVCSSDLPDHASTRFLGQSHIYLLAADLRVCTAVFELNVPQNAFCFHDDVVAMAIELRSQHLKRCFGAQQHLFGQFSQE